MTYLYARKLEILTGHNPLKWLMQIKEPTGRLARWSLLVQQYDFEVKYRKRTQVGNADALSGRSYDVPAIKAGLKVTKLKNTKLWQE